MLKDGINVVENLEYNISIKVCGHDIYISAKHTDNGTYVGVNYRSSLLDNRISNMLKQSCTICCQVKAVLSIDTGFI